MGECVYVCVSVEREMGLSVCAFDMLNTVCTAHVLCVSQCTAICGHIDT